MQTHEAQQARQMDIKNTTSRLRRTFHYPTDDSSNGGTPEVLDEEGKESPLQSDRLLGKYISTSETNLNPFPHQTEQDDLIQTLADQNAHTNQQYQTLLLGLPILASIPYILALFRPATFLIALLGLSSLASTAYLLLSLPPTETGIPLLDAWARSADNAVRPGSGFADADDNNNNDDDDQYGAESSALASGWSTSGGGGGGGAGASIIPSGLGTLDQRRRRRRRSRANSLSYEVPKGPLEKHLPFLNMGLCAILILYGLSAARGEGSGGGSDGTESPPHTHHFGWLGLGNLPAIVYIVVIIAKVVMASVDPERELAALKYDYKGA